jgi:hypothetical protein
MKRSEADIVAREIPTVDGHGGMIGQSKKIQDNVVSRYIKKVEVRVEVNVGSGA